MKFRSGIDPELQAFLQHNFDRVENNLDHRFTRLEKRLKEYIDTAVGTAPPSTGVGAVAFDNTKSEPGG